ncbi:NAD(P)/FAD-dependent oxidoreductase [Desulfobacter curvatus]|uniref:FAD/NAD(P)-dependent oxidoreductase n=1 Tax=Desulfobacter curvatus TaxID=2290 RepID=UPI000366DFBF|nr:NAD(P)/FAD-dependent oxidoreductase [Desulfobacter curvatus]
MNKCYDMVIVGAGPGGLAAAITADKLGLSTLVVDEQPEPGGQLYRSIERSLPENADTLGKDYLAGKQLVESFRASGITYLPNNSVWNIDNALNVDLISAGIPRRVRGRRLLFSVGAKERPVPIPNWTLPGVMGAAAADILFKSADMVPEGPVVLAGSGPLLLLVACHLVDNGVKISAMVETAGLKDYFKAMAYLPGALCQSRYLLKGLQMRLKLKRAGVPLYTGCRDLAVLGKNQAEGLAFTCRGKLLKMAAAKVLLHEGVVPNLRFSRLLNCEHEWYDPQRYWRPALDRWGRTSVPGVSVAGDAGGINGGAAAQIAGHIAAIDTACSLEVFTETERDRLAQPYLKNAHREKLIRPFIDHVFPPSRQALVPPDDETIVCRCEELTAGRIRDAIAKGARHPAQVKGRTRAGMGPCQGRMCGATIAEIIAERYSLDITQVGTLRVRPPLQPLSIEQLANPALGEKNE